MDNAVRTAGRELLIAELLDFASDRESHGKLQRAEQARAAAAELAAGVGEVVFEYVCYRVGEIDRHSIVRRPRAELIAELEEAAAGWEHFGSPLSIEAALGAAAIREGADSARVGHLVYEIGE